MSGLNPEVRLLILQGTPFCNIDCSYCYLPNRTATTRMSRETITAVVRTLIDDGLLGRHLTINWHAGEPLVMGVEFYRESMELLKPLSATGCYVVHSVQTNGTLIDAKWVQLFRDEHIRVGVSVDGPQFIHDAFRKTRKGLGTHAQTMAGIRQLQDGGVPISVITVLTERSVSGI